MPVLLSTDCFDEWLDSATPLRQVTEMLNPCAVDMLTAQPIGSYVNNVRHEGPACLGAAVPL
jgi:putative SOS response-associated peptidase YedK